MHGFVVVIACALIAGGVSAQVSSGDYRSDSLAVRGILDSNGLNTVRVEEVTRVRDGRISVLQLEQRNLESLPAVIDNLLALDTLFLRFNRLANLPLSITLLHAVVDIHGNRLCQVDSTIEKWLDEYRYCPGFCVNWRFVQDCFGSSLISPTKSAIQFRDISHPALFLHSKQIYDSRGRRQ